MAHLYRTVREPVVQETQVDDAYVAGRNVSMAERIIYLIGGIIIALLGLRFLLALLGANTANAFASFIYTTSHPFVAPFFGLFNYREQFGVSRIEVETLVAMAFWALLTWAVAYAVSLPSRRHTRTSSY